MREKDLLLETVNYFRFFSHLGSCAGNVDCPYQVWVTRANTVSEVRCPNFEARFLVRSPAAMDKRFVCSLYVTQ